MSFIGLSAIASGVAGVVGGGTLGAVLGGATAGVVGGAGLGAITGAATGQGAGRGALFGALGGGVTGGAGGAIFGGAAGSAGGAGGGAAGGTTGGTAGGVAGDVAGQAPGYVAQESQGIMGAIKPESAMGQLDLQGAGLVGPNGMPVAGAAPAGASGLPSGITPSGVTGQGLQAAVPPPLGDSGGGGAFGQIADEVPEAIGKTVLDTGVNKGIEGVSNTIAANKAKKEDEARGQAFYAANPELGGKPLAGGGSVALSDGQFIIPADIVSALGNGSTKAGAAFLDEFFGRSV